MRRLREQLLTTLYEEAINQGLVTENTLNRYQEALEKAGSSSRETAAILSETIDIFADLPVKDRQEASRLLALETLVMNTLNNYDHARTSRSPRQRFVDAFRHITEQANDPGRALERLIDSKEKMILSLVHTMHPTIYHTPEARRLEARLSRFLEEKTVYGHAMDYIEPASLEFFRDIISETVAGVRDRNFAITPMQSVTLPQEAETERENMAAIRDYIDDIVQEWNDAVEEFAADKAFHGNLRLHALSISEEDKNHMTELRTWGQGADADGREKSTSIQLYQTIFGGRYHDEKTGHYTGPTLDLRQNAEMHTNLVSALVQVQFRNSAGYGTLPSTDARKFEAFCEAFINSVNTPDDWRSPSQSIYQELRDHKATFARKLVTSDFNLIPEGIKASAVAFNEMFTPFYNQFLADHNLPPETTFDDLEYRVDPKDYKRKFLNLQRKLREQVKQQDVPLMIDGEPHTYRFFLSDDGLQYQQDNYMEGRDFLQERVTLDADGNYRMLSREERATLMDIAKRLIVINHAIDQFGPEVADRHQIANFGEASHFYEIMLLFKETGLIQVEGERVTDVKMGIQPLLETLEDMQAAPEMFRKLLEDPLVLSYYQQRGVAEFMLGFSDGAKSAGNFAGQWQIYKTAQALSSLFAEYDIPTRFFEGRGRGTDRGGSIEAGITRSLMPESVILSAIDDRTIQADLPMDMANSPFYGKDQLASMLVGIVTARDAALKRSEQEREILLSYEPAFDFIARVAAHHFREAVRENPDTAKFLFSMPQNPDISSRKSKRSGTAKQDYEAVRAIRNEYAANFADLPYNHVGLKQALEAFVSGEPVTVKENGKSVSISSENITVLDKEGNPVTGERTLQTLTAHPFFRAFLEVAESGLQHYDPDIAAAYGRKLELEPFISMISSHLTGLKERVGEVLRGGEQAAQEATETNAAVERLKALDTAGHALIHTLPDMRPNKRQYKQDTEIIRNALFVNANEISHREPGPELRKVSSHYL